MAQTRFILVATHPSTNVTVLRVFYRMAAAHEVEDFLTARGFQVHVANDTPGADQYTPQK
jgi:hypothetical protein